VAGGAIVGAAIGGYIGNALDNVFFSKGGRQRHRQSDMENVRDEEVSRKARDNTIDPQERKRYQEEEKARRLRNKQKRC
jgi:hypothetical protein